MPELDDFPFGLALALLWCVAMLRGQATYWLARTLTEQGLRHTRPTRGWRASAHAWLAGDALDRGRGAVQRCGIAAVPLCYLTVGVQTVVLASAGVLRMPWVRFTLAQSVGAAAWAGIYATVGFAVWATVVRRALDGGLGPWTVAVLAVLLTVAVALGHRVLVLRRRRRGKMSSTSSASSAPSPEVPVSDPPAAPR